MACAMTVGSATAPCVALPPASLQSRAKLLYELKWNFLPPPCSKSEQPIACPQWFYPVPLGLIWQGFLLEETAVVKYE